MEPEFADRPGFTTQWLAVLPSLKRFCAKKLCSLADTEDVVQQTAFHAWSGYSSLRDPSRFNSWAFSIANAEIARAIGTRMRGRALAKSLTPDAAAVVHQDPLSLAGPVQGWVEDVLRQATDAGILPAKEAAVVRHHLNGDENSWQQTSKSLGISPNDCAQSFLRAVPKIRAWVLLHHRELVGGTAALAAAARNARLARPNPLSDFEYEVFSARILNNDETYSRAGWRTALRTACSKIVKELALPGAAEELP